MSLPAASALLVHADSESIAAEVGYIDGTTLRTLLRQRLGRGVRNLHADLPGSVEYRLTGW
jgi:hypothetical protein